MTNKGIKTAFLMLPLIVGIFSGCAKHDTITITNNKPVTAKVSFSKDLLPLLVANCGTAGCHVANRTAPDLEKTVAYKSIKALKMIDVNNPEGSIIYERMTGKLIPAMPIGKSSNPDNINNIMLAWIKQGALDN